MARKSYMDEGNEVAKNYISDTWADIFDDTHQFFHGGIESVRIALDKYRLRTGYKLEKVKIDQTRLTYRCVSKPNFKCSWHLHTVAVNKSNEVFKIKKYVKKAHLWSWNASEKSNKNIDNWMWFMKNLKECVDDREITFITDNGEG
ncbi:hypothetical protein MKW94_007084 [Papaver nudicaule]|uniref:Transposase MuDR plant domain-containing protein n=1 Tax=Papaver nudicaule TaxID=74823 RepID=A0AA42B2Y6_PAPNU|nr:hypothetical protein [Papaver nudicaule]